MDRESQPIASVKCKEEDKAVEYMSFFNAGQAKYRGKQFFERLEDIAIILEKLFPKMEIRNDRKNRKQLVWENVFPQRRSQWTTEWDPCTLASSFNLTYPTYHFHHFLLSPFAPWMPPPDPQWPAFAVFPSSTPENAPYSSWPLEYPYRFHRRRR